MRVLLLLACLMGMGCWNGENVHVRLGDVSIGRQLIDLKAALEQGAMTKAEYDRVRPLLLSLGPSKTTTERAWGSTWPGRESCWGRFPRGKPIPPAREKLRKQRCNPALESTSTYS